MVLRSCELSGLRAPRNHIRVAHHLSTAFLLAVALAIPLPVPAQQPPAAGSSATQARQGQNGTTDPAGGNGAARTEGAAPIANRIDESQLVGLPLNGRSYTQLATLEAGVSDPSAANSSRGTGGGSLNVSGGRASSNTFLLDGTNIMDTGNRSSRSAAGVQLGTDSVLQVLVFSTTYTTEYGRGSGGVLNSITRSGSNEFHGALFEFLRNSKFDARNWVERGPEPVEPAPFKRNQFGFTITGPIRKDKTYFMGSFEALRDRLSDSQLDTFIDTSARQGIIVDKDGRPRPAACPTPPGSCVAPQLGSVENPIQIPASVKRYLLPEVMPIPNAELLGGGLAHNVASQFLPTNESFFTIRVDHAFSQRDSIFARYSFDDATGARGGGIFAFGSRVQSRQQYATLVGSHIFSTRLVSSFRVGYTRPVDATESISVIDIPSSLFFVRTAPQFGVINVPGMVGFGPAGTSPEFNKMNSFQFAGDILAQRGPHGLKFGMEVNRYRWDVRSGRDQSGTWNFNSLESFLQGGPDGTSVTVALPGSDNSKAWRQTLFGFYVQDGYRFRSNLQLSLGLRYEFTTLIHDRLGRTSHLEDILRDTKMTRGPLLDHNPSLGNLSPRIGVSWSPGGSQSTLVSAGFGIYFDQLLGYALDTQKNAAPFYSIGTNPTFDSRSTFPDALAGASQLGGTFPQQGLSLDYHDFTDTRVLRYEFGIQHRLPQQTNVQLSYVGARGNHVWRNYEANLFPAPIIRTDGSLFFPDNCVATPPPREHIPSALCRSSAGPVNPAFQSGINIMASDAQSFYNSFLLTADTRLSRALTLRASFTYSKSIDDASSIGTSASAQQYGLDRKLDRSLSDFDNRKRLSGSFFYNLPAPKGQTGFLSVASQIVGGWRIGGIMSFRTSTPTTAKITVRRPGYLFAAVRPNLVPGQSNNPNHGVSIGCKNPDGTTFIEAGRKIAGPALFYDPCVFTVPPAGTIGNLGRNTLTGPSLVNLDISLQRDFPLGGDRRLQFRTEIFNVANHTNFRTPTANSMQVFTGGGRYNTGVGLYVNTSTTSRQIQFALRLSF